MPDTVANRGAQTAVDDHAAALAPRHCARCGAVTCVWGAVAIEVGSEGETIEIGDRQVTSMRGRKDRMWCSWPCWLSRQLHRRPVHRDAAQPGEDQASAGTTEQAG